MSDTNTPEERIEIAAAERLAEIREDRLNEEALASVRSKSSLDSLAVISVIGFLVAIVGFIVVLNAETIQTVTIWGGLVGTGVTVGFFSLIAYLATKAIINSR